MLCIHHGTVLPMAGGTFTEIPDGRVFVDGTRIVAVGNKELDPPSGISAKDITWLDAKDGIIMPGIVEAHCHMGITEEKKGMEGDDCNESVNPITPQLRAIDAINPMDAAFGDAVRAGITCAMIGPGSSNVVGGQFAIVKTYGRCIDEMVVKAPAAMKIAFGENPKVNFSGMGQSLELHQFHPSLNKWSIELRHTSISSSTTATSTSSSSTSSNSSSSSDSSDSSSDSDSSSNEATHEKKYAFN